MQTINFKYQHFWCRTIFLVPIIVLLAIIEYELLLFFLKEVNNWLFFIFSAIIMFSFVFKVYPHISKLFLRKGTLEIPRNDISFINIKKNKRQTIKVETIKDVSIDLISLYGVRIAKLEIDFEYVEKRSRLVFYSEDLGETELKNCDLYSVYTCIKNIIR